MTWTVELDGTVASDMIVESTNLAPAIKLATETYIDSVLDKTVEAEVGKQVPEVVDNKFQ